MRDEEEQVVFEYGLRHGIPMAGICRGGQFLNVMCGGKMYQHVDGHATGTTHAVSPTIASERLVPTTFQVTSTHHQMMIPSEMATLLLVADMASRLEYMTRGSIGYKESAVRDDTEALWYPEQKVLCFQPHPEYLGKDSECQKAYFSFIAEFLGVSSAEKN